MCSVRHFLVLIDPTECILRTGPRSHICSMHYAVQMILGDVISYWRSTLTAASTAFGVRWPHRPFSDVKLIRRAAEQKTATSLQCGSHRTVSTAVAFLVLPSLFFVSLITNNGRIRLYSDYTRGVKWIQSLLEVYLV